MPNAHHPCTQQALKTVAVVVPLSNRAELTPDEEVSLRHLVHFLGHYDKYLVIPKSLKVNYPDFKIKRFNDMFFGSAVAHTRLMLSPKFYESFREYKYILNYHLDALVFSDQLMQWCGTDLDYIGAPWLMCHDTPYVKAARVGNGGFSLRKIESFLRVINSRTYAMQPTEYWEHFYASQPRHIRLLNLPKKYLKYLRLFNNAKWEMSKWNRINLNNNDDLFWSDVAVKYYPEFKVASVETGLRFAFEVAPRWCFELNNYTLPFGCHAWPKYDRDFWEPYLLK
jgi:hypothetical protein